MGFVVLFREGGAGDWFDLYIVKAAKEGQFSHDFDAIHSIIQCINTKDRDIDRVSAHLRMCARMKNIPEERQAPEDHGA